MVEKDVKAVACDFKKLAIFAEKFVLKHEAFLIEKVNNELLDFLHKQYNYHNKNLEHDADCCEKGLTKGILYAYTDVFKKIRELNPPTDADSADCGFDELKQELETYYCTLCQKNRVDVESGNDTCDSCLNAV